MKIIGQSTVASGTPYLHLGYLAATTVKPDGKFLGAGGLLLIIGLLMGFTLIVGKTARGLTRSDLKARGNRRLALAGTAIIVLGVVSLFLSFKYGKEFYQHPDSITFFRARAILQTAGELQRVGHALPEGLADVKAASPAAEIEDGWRNPMRLERTGPVTQPIFLVLSAGPDGQFGTDDDKRYSADERKLP